KPFHGAGLVVLADGQTYLRLERAAMDSEGKLYEYVNWELRQNGRWTRQGEANELPLANLTSAPTAGRSLARWMKAADALALERLERADLERWLDKRQQDTTRKALAQATAESLLREIEAEAYTQDYRHLRGRLAAPEPATYLRLERRGGTVYAS